MNKQEYLLVCLGEECGEVHKAASKALRFGIEDRKDDESPTNREKIEQEFNDVIAVVQLLAEECNIIINIHSDLIKEKKGKVRRLFEYSRERGQLTE